MTTQGKKRKENKSRNDNLQHYHEPGPYIVEDRRMISRAAGDSKSPILFDMVGDKPGV